MRCSFQSPLNWQLHFMVSLQKQNQPFHLNNQEWMTSLEAPPDSWFVLAHFPCVCPPAGARTRCWSLGPSLCVPLGESLCSLSCLQRSAGWALQRWSSWNDRHMGVSAVLPVPSSGQHCPCLGCRSTSSTSSSSDRRKRVLIPDQLLMIPNPATDSGNS